MKGMTTFIILVPMTFQDEMTGFSDAAHIQFVRALFSPATYEFKQILWINNGIGQAGR